jgi:anti-sigma factor RsiW
VWANEEASLARWLTRRMGTQAHIPDLGPLGYTLVGGRLVAGQREADRLVMYENADKQRLTLQWRISRDKPDASGETAFRYMHEDGVGVFHWVDDDCAYALSGPFDRPQLLGIARVVYGPARRGAQGPRGPRRRPRPAPVPKPPGVDPRACYHRGASTEGKTDEIRTRARLVARPRVRRRVHEPPDHERQRRSRS